MTSPWPTAITTINSPQSPLPTNVRRKVHLFIVTIYLNDPSTPPSPLSPFKKKKKKENVFFARLYLYLRVIHFEPSASYQMDVCNFALDLLLIDIVAKQLLRTLFCVSFVFPGGTGRLFTPRPQ